MLAETIEIYNNAGENSMAKIVTKEQYLEIRKNMVGKRVGLCHGVFDLIHPGHIIHFEEAKSVCDILVVSVTAAEYVRKGPGRPYFTDEMRLKFLSEISCIDYVMLSEGYTVDDIIECVEPDLYIKGQEYAKAEDDLTGMIDSEVELVRIHGGEVYYTSGQVFSSTKLINRGLSALPSDVVDYSTEFIKKYTIDTIRQYTEKLRKLKVLVIGDVIIDKYTYCSLQGLMSKDAGYSARFKTDEEHLGGAIAIARHIAGFSEEVTMCSVIGNEPDKKARFQNELEPLIKLELLSSEKFPTIVKHRYLEKDKKRDELHKIFVINNIPDPARLDDETERKFKQKVTSIIKDYDVVFLCDFGHGLINEGVMEIVQEGARFLALNCQTNSTNQGMNIITKYDRADVFALDQRELKLAFPSYKLTEEEALAKLCRHLGNSGFLTRGSAGAYGLDKESNSMFSCPAFTLNVVDTIGAGDAFFALAGLYRAIDTPMEVSLFMGNIAGALAANIIGNKESLKKANVLKYASTLLNV